MEEIITHYRAEPEDCFWATHGGAEIDLLINSPRTKNL